MNPFEGIPILYLIPVTVVCLVYTIVGFTGFLYEPKDRELHEHKWLRRFCLNGKLQGLFGIISLLIISSYLIHNFTSMDLGSTVSYLGAIGVMFGWFWLCVLVVISTEKAISMYKTHKRMKK